ncbi:MAG: cation diffusion facilitator family transporter [Lachnospira sp.]
MTDLLSRLFVKNYKDTKNPEVRLAYGMFAGIVGIVCNIILFLFKLTAGFVTSSVSIMADAINNLSDAGSSIVTLAGFKLASKPADTQHPYGHGRIEYISGFIVSGLIVIMGFELFRTSLDKVIHPEPLEFSVVSIVILVGSIFVKLWMSSFNRKLGNRVDSAAMKATSIDSLSDCISTTVVLAGVIFTQATGINIDGIAGVIVAFFVMYAGFGAAKDTLQPLLGQPPEREFVEEIEKLLLEDEHIIGMHDLVVHNYGPGRVFVSVHAEVPSNLDMMMAHDVIDMAERRIGKKMGCFVTIHMDPVVTDDEIINELKQMVVDIVNEVSSELSIHDFRTVSGPYLTNLIFDVLVPYGFKMSDEEVVHTIQKKITDRHSNCQAVIQVDKQMY